MGTTPRGVNFEEIMTPEFTYTRDSITALRVFKIDWEDVDRFMIEAFPGGTVTNGGVVIPESLKFPGKPYLLIQDVKVTAFDPENPTANDGNGVATADEARVEITYSTASYSEGGNGGPDNPTGEDGQIIFSHAIQVGGEYYQLPANSLSWTQPTNNEFEPPEDANQFENLQAAKLIPLIEHVITLYRVPELPIEIIVDKIGRVNLQYDQLFYAPPETLLFMGCNASRKVTTDGAEAWEIEYRFSQRVVWQRYRLFLPNGDPVQDGDGDPVYDIEAVGWQDFINPATGRWQTLYLKGGDKVYATTENFLALFYAGADAENSSSSS